jgi:hypothetical protein
MLTIEMLDLLPPGEIFASGFSHRPEYASKMQRLQAFALLAIADSEKRRGLGFSLGIIRENAQHELIAVGRVIGV